MEKQTTQRERGNFFYTRATTLNGEEKIVKVFQAIRAYEEGKKIASSEGNCDEWLSCVRSIGVASFHLANDSRCQNEKSTEWVLHVFKRGVESFCDSISYNMKPGDQQRKQWTEIVIEKLAVLIKAASSFIGNKSSKWQERCNFLEKLMPSEADTKGAGLQLVHLLITVSVAEAMVKEIFITDQSWQHCLYMTEEVSDMSACLADTSIKMTTNA